MGSTRIGAVGFCWGGWAILRAASWDSKDAFCCGVVAHPAIQNQMLQRHGPNVDDMFRQVRMPILLCTAWNDPASCRESGYLFKLLLENNGKGARSKAALFPRQAHGFANRADVRDPKNKVDVDRFMRMTVLFLKDHINAHGDEDVQPAKL